MREILKIAVAAALVVCTSVAMAADPGVTDNEIVIGGVAPYTGPAGPLGYAITLGLRLGAEEVNANGGINGRKLKVVVEDDQYVPAQSVQALQKLIDVHNVFALGAISGGSHGLAMMPIIEKNKIPAINPAVTTEAHYAVNRPNVFGIGMTYQDAVIDMMKLVNKLHPNEKWGSMVQDDDSGAAREVSYEKAVKDMSLTSVLKQRFKPKQMDFSAEVLRLKASGATALHLGGLPAVNAAIMKEAVKQGMKLKFAGLFTDHTPVMIDLAGAEGDGMYVYDFVPSVSDKVASGSFLRLVEKYLPKDDQPKVNRYSILGYMTMKVYANAIRACGKDVTRACVSANIEKTQNLDAGVGAPVSFGPGIRLSAPKGNLLKIDFAGKQFVPVK